MALDYSVQDYPITDSTQTDSFESLISTYYQLHGYITSSSKWFWVQKDNQQRVYQDIDVLAINGTETVIVSAVANLNDKVGCTKEGKLNQKKLETLIEYFERSQSYLNKVDEYQWMVNNGRVITKVVAFGYGDTLADRARIPLKRYKIQLLSATEAVQFIKEETQKLGRRGFKTNNQLMKTVQLITRDL